MEKSQGSIFRNMENYITRRMCKVGANEVWAIEWSTKNGVWYWKFKV